MKSSRFLVIAVALGVILSPGLARASLSATSPDGRYEAQTHSSPGVLIIRDLRYEKLGRQTVIVAPTMNQPIQDLAFSPDSRQLATRGMKGRILLWDVLPGGGLELSGVLPDSPPR